MHILYNLDDGSIAGELECSPNLIEANRECQLTLNIGVVENITDVGSITHYHDLINTIRVRPAITAEPNKTTITADGTDIFILTGLPIPCTITVDESEYQVGDGEFGFPTTLAGTYTVKASQFPYIDKSWEVIAI